VTCYFYLGALTVVGGLRRKWIAPLLFLSGYLFHNAALHQPELGVRGAQVLEHGWIYGTHVPLFRSVFLAFLAGMTCYQFRDLLRWRGWMAAVAVAALIISCRLQAFDLVWPFALPYLVLFLAHRLPFRQVEQWGDFSYGIYIYAFPIQQCLVLAGLHHFGFLLYFGVSTILAVFAGMVSWFALERPILKWARSLSQRFKRAVQPPEAARQLELLPKES
jgi:peptidoglycan/LPS O-acetylase OafA/YrhL